jgi:hypothetical protein
MTKESYETGYRYGVKLALDSFGIVKTGGMKEYLQKALEGVSGVPSWAKGMGAGAAAGGGLGAVAGDDFGDILSGAAGGAALGGMAGGGAGALSKAVQGPGAGVLERLGLGGVGKAKGLAGEARGANVAASKRLQEGAQMRLPEKMMGDLRGDMLGAGAAETQALGGIGPAASAQAEQVLSPGDLQALGLMGGGAGVAGAL